MHTMDQHLAELVNDAATITHETALEKCHDVEDFSRLVAPGGAT